MVWITRSIEQIAYQLPMLLNSTYAFVYYTGKDKIKPRIAESFLHFSHCVLYHGRPDIPTLINWIVHSQHGELAHELIPTPDASLSSATEAERARNIVAEARKKGRPSHEGTGGPPEEKSELSAANDLVIELQKHMPHNDRSAWCVLYCGGVKQVQDDLRSSCEEWQFLYSEESFAW